MKHQYLINVWIDSSNNGVACWYRTTSKREWLAKIKEAMKYYGITKKTCRTAVYDTYTIFSFPANASASYAWADIRYTRSLIDMHYGFPKGYEA